MPRIIYLQGWLSFQLVKNSQITFLPTVHTYGKTASRHLVGVKHSYGNRRPLHFHVTLFTPWARSQGLPNSILRLATKLQYYNMGIKSPRYS